VLEHVDYWIAKGCLVPKPESDDAGNMSDRSLLDRHNLVKVSVDEEGVTIRWQAFGPNWASLFFAKEWIGTFRGPYTLCYFISGWFTETYADPASAKDRIDQLIAKSDLHLSSRIYTKVLDPRDCDLPENIRAALETGVAPLAASIDCLLDSESGRVKVERIGESSAIAKLWGMSPVSAPCLAGTSYDKVTTRGYVEALRTGRPHYDHVYAAMMGRDGEISWIPYQRVVMPHAKARGRWRMVSVVSEVTPVAIAVV
jgi:hypothetical protein